MIKHFCWFMFIGVIGLLLITGCHDSRYDQCEKDHPDTHSYRLCVKKFQDQDSDDAALVSSITLMASAATIQ